jgi:hypothetical protein
MAAHVVIDAWPERDPHFTSGDANTPTDRWSWVRATSSTGTRVAKRSKDQLANSQLSVVPATHPPEAGLACGEAQCIHHRHDQQKRCDRDRGAGPPSRLSAGSESPGGSPAIQGHVPRDGVGS